VMADKEHYARRTEELFWEDLQLKGAEYKKLSARKRRLDRALLELQGVALSSGTLVSAVLELTKDGEDYKLVCHKSAVIHPRLAAQSQSAPASKPAKPKSAMDQRSAEELVKHFYKLFHTQAKDVCPTRKEIGQASTLLKEY